MSDTPTKDRAIATIGDFVAYCEARDIQPADLEWIAAHRTRIRRAVIEALRADANESRARASSNR